MQYMKSDTGFSPSNLLATCDIGEGPSLLLPYFSVFVTEAALPHIEREKSNAQFISFFAPQIVWEGKEN